MKRCRIDSQESSKDESAYSILDTTKPCSTANILISSEEDSENDESGVKYNTKKCTVLEKQTSKSKCGISTSESRPSSSGWLCKPRSSISKLQQFAFQRTDRHNKKENETDTKHPEAPRYSTQEDTECFEQVKPDTDPVLCAQDIEDDSTPPLSVENKTLQCEMTQVELQMSCGTPEPQIELSPKPTLEELEDACSENSDCYDSDEGYSYRQRKAILEFLNKSTLEEICIMPSCSATKAKLLVKHQPYDNWDVLVCEMLM